MTLGEYKAQSGMLIRACPIELALGAEADYGLVSYRVASRPGHLCKQTSRDSVDQTSTDSEI